MSIKEAIYRIQERMAAACSRRGRDASEVRLMGVSKFPGRDAVNEAYDAGLRLFGESRVQEAAEKFSSFKSEHPDAELHLIGSLQRNKARQAVQLFDSIQSVDRVSLID